MRRILALLLFIAVPALGDNLFVDVNNPEGYATIAEAVKRADDGDAIFISEGFYSETISLEKNVSLIGEGADKVLLSYAQAGNAINIGANVDTSAHIEGMTITAKGGVGIDCTSGGSITVLNCVLSRSGQQGINLHGSASVIRNNQIIENTNGSLYAQNDQGSIISNNVIMGNLGGPQDSWRIPGCLFLRDQGANTVVANNLIKGNNGNGIMLWGSSATLKNNVSVENTGGGIYFHGLNVQLSAPLITSNIVANNQSFGLYTRSNATPVITYNCVFDNVGGDYGDGVSQDVGGIEDDPEFVNPSKGDYHLQEGSPCIDTGLTGAAHVDPDGSRNDMGMYGGPLASLWIEPYNGPVVTGVEVNPASVQQGGTITIRATGTTVREE
jgi:parallel beta-helix repeat protein